MRTNKKLYMTASKFAAAMLVLFASIFLLVGCDSMFGNKAPATVGELAFDSSAKHGFTLYLEENGQYKPYLVLSKNYNGNALLVRKELLNDTMPFDENFSFYDGSAIDTYLNGSFLNSFSQDTKALFTDSTIEITASESIDRVETKTVFIERKVFLLSHTEIGFNEHPMAVPEGTALKYFKDYQNRIAYKDGQTHSWWLRTPYTGYATTAWIVGKDSSMVEAAIDGNQGVRPAFCINGDLTIEKAAVGSDGTEGFILSNNK